MNYIQKLWLYALLMLSSVASAQTTAFFRISAIDANTEILDLHKWGVLVWSNQTPSPPTYVIQSCPTLDGPWTNLNNGYPLVGHSNIYAQIVVPEFTPTNAYDAGLIGVVFDIALSGGGEVLSSLGLTGTPVWDGFWIVNIPQGQEVEWCAILESNPNVLEANLITLTNPVPYKILQPTMRCWVLATSGESPER